MVRKVLVLVVTASALVTVVRRRRAKGDVDLWHEATSAIDLR